VPRGREPASREPRPGDGAVVRPHRATPGSGRAGVARLCANADRRHAPAWLPGRRRRWNLFTRKLAPPRSAGAGPGIQPSGSPCLRRARHCSREPAWGDRCCGPCYGVRHVPGRPHDPGAGRRAACLAGRCRVPGQALSGWRGWSDRGSVPSTTTVSNPYRGFRYPAEVIEHAVWLYHCFSLVTAQPPSPPKTLLPSMG